MIFYELEKFYTEGDCVIEKFFISKEHNRKILNGVSTPDGNISIVFNHMDGKFTDFPIGGTVLPLVSEKFRQLLENGEDCNHLEFLPIEYGNNEQVPPKYWLMNILNNISCFDWEHSVYTRYPDSMKELAGRPETVDKLVIDESKVNGRNIFRIKELPTNIFISKALKNKLQKEKISGIHFTKSNEFEKW